MFELVVKDILGTLRFLPYAILDGILVVVVYKCINRIRDKWTQDNKPKREKDLVLFIFSVYLASIIYITILSRPPGSRNEVDLRLFETIGDSIRSISYVVENVLLFIPFGMLTPLLNKRLKKIQNCIFTGFVCSFLIELTQMITKRGYFQLDDIMTNVVGTIVGFLVYGVLKHF